MVVRCFKLYIDYIGGTLNIGKYAHASGNAGNNRYREMQLLYTWAVFSTIDNAYHTNKHNKYIKYENQSKPIFASAIHYLS